MQQEFKGDSAIFQSNLTLLLCSDSFETGTCLAVVVDDERDELDMYMKILFCPQPSSHNINCCFNVKLRGSHPYKNSLGNGHFKRVICRLVAMPEICMMNTTIHVSMGQICVILSQQWDVIWRENVHICESFR